MVLASWTPQQWEQVRQALFAAASGLQNSVRVDDRCVNEGAQRADGTYCTDRAGESGWCSRCWSEIVP